MISITTEVSADNYKVSYALDLFTQEQNEDETNKESNKL